jgi:probable rRNA maturation factor
MEISVRDKTKSQILTTHKLKKLAKEVVGVVLDVTGHRNVEVSVVFVDDDEMEELNLRHRREKKSTDVLSFPQHDQAFARIRPELLGDVVISVPTAQQQAKLNGHSVQKEISNLLIHGILHLIGYTHESDEDGRKMRAKEEECREILEDEYSHSRV